MIALGAMDKHNVPITIIARGFNFERPQEFRSTVLVQYAEPFEIPG